MRDLFPHLRAILGPQRAKPMQRRALLRLVAFAAEDRQPLAPLLEAWSYDERGAQRLRLRRLAKALRKGMTLPDSLERYPGALSDDETLMIRFASESGTLASSIHANLESEKESTAVLDGNVQRLKNYAFLMVVIGLPMVVWFNAVFQPTVEQIAYDFGAVPPLGDTVRIFGSFASLVLGAIAIGLLLATLARSGGRIGRFVRRRVAPLFFSSLRDKRGAEVLQFLGESATAGRPLAGAIATLARHHYDPALRHKLLYARNELSLGADLWPTLTKSRLTTKRESAALSASDHLGVIGWTLMSLADVRRRHSLRQMSWMSSLAVPVIVFAFGVFVLVQSISLLSFVTELIISLA
jgi:type IV pilus assembly protein PilC